MNCCVCGKSFTGIENFQQHEQSEKHKKKVRNLEIRNSTAESTTIPNLVSTQNQIFYCQVCNISCVGVEKFQIHSLSLEHIRMAMKSYEKDVPDTSNLKPKQEPSASTDCKNSLNCGTSSVEQINDFLQPEYQYASSTHSSYSECKVCKKMFTGPEPHRQHLESAMHKKKIAVLNNAALSSTDDQNTMFNVLKCEICNKHFSGPFPYDQHLKSDVHKRKMQNNLFRERYGKNYSFAVMDEADSSSEPTKKMKNDNVHQTQCDAVSSPWYCNICKKQCTGSIPYKMHLEGDIHRKNKFKAEISQSRIKDSERKLYKLSNNCDEQNIAKSEIFVTENMVQENYNFTEMKAETQHNASVADEDYIVPGLNDLKILTFDNLNLMYFQPDEEIVLD